MKTYEYKVITIWNQSLLNEYDFNALGGEGFRVVSHVSVPAMASESDPMPPPQCEQFLMEKETEND